MSAPTRIAIAELMKKLSPAPATSLGEGLRAGRRSVSNLPSCSVLISTPSAPSVMTRFSARAFWISVLGDRGKAGLEIVQGEAGLALGRGDQGHALEAGDIADLRGGLAVGRQHHVVRARLGRDGIDQILRQAAIVEAGEQQQIALLQRLFDGLQHSGLDVGARRMMTQMIDAQQRLVQRRESAACASSAGCRRRRGRSGRPVLPDFPARNLRIRRRRRACNNGPRRRAHAHAPRRRRRRRRRSWSTIGVTTMVGSSCDMPTASQVTYSSMMRSPITSTRMPAILARIDFRSASWKP